MAFNTGNPVPSSDAKDLSDNTENLDSALNTNTNKWTDRLGVHRDTVKGRIDSMGFSVPVVYAGGISFTVNDNVKTVDEGGVVYAPLPSALPFTTSGVFVGDDDAKFFVVQGVPGVTVVTVDDLKDKRYTASFDTELEAKNSSDASKIFENALIKITEGGGYDWEVINTDKVAYGTRDIIKSIALPLLSFSKRNTKFNLIPDFDSDSGSALTLGIDENLGKLNRVNYNFADISVDDSTPSHNLTLDSKIVIPRFRVRANITGDTFPITIQTATKFKEDVNVIVLATGESLTPLASFKSGTQAFANFTKGIGQGIVQIFYQYQDPKTRARKKALVWEIDLDDGSSVHTYKMLLPQCSTSTMNGAYKLGDSTALNWVITAKVGPVVFRGDGVNLADTPVVNRELFTVDPATLTNGEFISDYYDGHEINFINIKASQNAGGKVSTLTNIKIDFDLS